MPNGTGTMPISQEDWWKLKANEAYGMYAEAMKKHARLKGQIDNLTKENYDLYKTLGKLTTALTGLTSRFEKLKERMDLHCAIGEFCPHTGK